MYQLILNDGTELLTSGAGAADGHLWIYDLSLSMADAATIFADPEKTSKITVHYQDDLPDDVFEGFTTLRGIMADENGLKVCLRAEE